MSAELKKILKDAGVEISNSFSSKAEREEYAKIMLKWFSDS